MNTLQSNYAVTYHTLNNILTMENVTLLILTVLCLWKHTQLLNVPCLLF
jgi:hypothetical protein